MARKLEEYGPIVGFHVIEELMLLAERLMGKVIQTINSTAVGGGVAEILHHLVPLLHELEIDIRWDIIRGGEAFFQTTKAFHNALHGKEQEITEGVPDLFGKYRKKLKHSGSFWGCCVHP